MTIKLTDTFAKISAIRRDIHKLDLEAWRGYAESTASGICEECLSNAAESIPDADVLESVREIITERFDRIETAHRVLGSACLSLGRRASELFAEDFDIHIYYILSLCNSAAWSAALEGKWVVLLGAESIAKRSLESRGCVNDLICREAARLILFNYRKKAPWTGSYSTWCLYTEGFSTRIAQKLYSEDSYGPVDEGWLRYCRENTALLKAEYQKRLISGSSAQDMFSDTDTYCGRHHLGRYLGCEFIRMLENTYTDEQIALFRSDEIESMLFRYLMQ